MYIYEEEDGSYTAYTTSEHENLQRSASAVNVYKIDVIRDRLIVSIVKSRYGRAEIVIQKYKG